MTAATRRTPRSTRPRNLGLTLFLLRIVRNWLRIVMVVLAVYISLPWVAPTLMKVGLEAPARVIYTLYRPFCHQMGFRTLHLYGEQSVYPLAPVAAIIGVRPYEAYVGQSNIPMQMRQHRLPQPPFNVEALPAFYGIDVPDDVTPDTPTEDQNFVAFQLAAMSFVGNEQMGYKMTLCERDIAIYTSMFLFLVIYSQPAVRRRLRPLPLWLFVFLGVLPIAIDGVSQLVSYPPFNWWEPRETLPLFRILTGICFGTMTAWLGFPYIDMSMRDAQYDLEAKLKVAGIDPALWQPGGRRPSASVGD
jgi:uncharacterized membrane protein